MTEDIQLELPSIRWWSQGDENSFFRWLSAIPGYRTCQGFGSILKIAFDSSAVERATLYDLVAIFRRYELPMELLKGFKDGNDGAWFSSPERAWHKSVFKTPGDSVYMTPGFTIRVARLDDVADIKRLVHALAEYERLSDEAVSTEAHFREHLFGATPRAYAAIAEIDRRAVGIAIWFYSYNTFTGCPGLYVEDVFVDPEHRGAGIGMAFFRHMARQALERNCTRMEWSVLDWNEPAIKFYRSIGAIGMDEWTVQRLDADKLAALAQGA